MTVGQPEKLSAARLMFGYVGTDAYSEKEALTFCIGLRERNGRKERSDFAQLAGRVGCNLAVEQDTDRPLEQRFLNAPNGCLVPLRPLGMPRPSAVEHYLTQDRLDDRIDDGILCTYGDTPDDSAVGRLRGRKFYLHQPDAARPKGEECYELLGPSCPDWKAGTKFNLLGDQAAVARFVSKPGTQFRFAIRFVNLKDWELGALLFTLQPTLEDVKQLHDGLPEPAQKALTDWIQKLEKAGWNTQPDRLLAHKLGHGRPLGLGSVKVSVDRLRRLERSSSLVADLRDHTDDALRSQRQQTIDALVQYLVANLGSRLGGWVEHCLVPWLQVHRYAGRTRFDYPRRAEKSETTIFNYHTDLRGRHANGRKRKRSLGSKPRQGLPELNELDPM